MPLLGVEQSLAGTRSSHRSKSDILATLPDDRELTGLFSVYRARVHSFQPIVEDLPAIERQLCIIIKDRYALQDVADAQTDTTIHLERIRILCVIHAILASGAQFSDLPATQRAMVSRRHAQHAFDLLVACDYIARPSIATLQALLILGHVLQNTGKPQAAWILGGSTIRMAVALGVLPENVSTGQPKDRISRETARSIRLAIVWQDALLSLAFGLSTMAHEMDLEADLPPLHQAISSHAEGFTYGQAMHWICHNTLQHRASSTSRVGTVSEPQVKAFLESMYALERSLRPHLRDAEECYSIEALQEHYSLELHRHTAIATFCRPILSKSLNNTFSGRDVSDLMLRNLRGSLKRSVKAFIRLRSITSYATRSWAFVHNGLTSALLLSFMKETRTDRECLQIQTDLIGSLARGEGGIAPEASQNDTDQGQLTEMHQQCLKALKSLRKLAEEEISRPGQGEEQGQLQECEQEGDHAAQASSPQFPDPLLDQRMIDFDEMFRNYDFTSPLPIEAYDRITCTNPMLYESQGLP